MVGYTVSSLDKIRGKINKRNMFVSWEVFNQDFETKRNLTNIHDRMDFAEEVESFLVYIQLTAFHTCTWSKIGTLCTESLLKW